MVRIPLPRTVQADQAKAEFRNGVLRVTLAKPPEERRRCIQIPVRAT